MDLRDGSSGNPRLNARLPVATKRIGGITIKGGNDIIVIGGRITIARGVNAPESQGDWTAFILNDVAGIAQWSG